MRVNHSSNLTLMIPILTGLLVGYFFFFGLFFDTVIFGVFDINYLKYAGIEDLFLNMLRFGGMITLILIFIWISYAILLFFICGIWLIVRMIRTTQKTDLNFVDRLKIIGLSLAVFSLNILLMLVVLFPKRNRKGADKMILKRENFVRAILEMKDKSATAKAGKPFITANDIFQNYLYFKSVGNHRFFMSIFLLLIVTLGVTYHAGGKAENARACVSVQKGNQQTQHEPLLPFPAFILERPCQLTMAETQTEEAGLTDIFISSLTGFFDFTPMIVQAPNGQIDLLHLATTSRFDLFFNGKDGRSLALPRGTLTLLYADQKEEDSAQSVSTFEEKLKKLEEYLSDSSRTLFGLGKDLKKTNEELVQLNKKNKHSSSRHTGPHRSRQSSYAAKVIPVSCWNRKPEQVIGFALGSYVIEDANTLDALVHLTSTYRRDKENSVVITGYADPVGSTSVNLKISLQRALHVANLIEKLGISRQRILPIGMGENDSMELPQRRVEIRSCRFEE
ncbi:MAG: OmpA family protein [Sneathiella sp.]|nr:OmpA family protein [Sneathiella sp.]